MGQLAGVTGRDDRADSVMAMSGPVDGQTIRMDAGADAIEVVMADRTRWRYRRTHLHQVDASGNRLRVVMCEGRIFY